MKHHAFVFGIASLVAACAAQPRRPLYGTAPSGELARAGDVPPARLLGAPQTVLDASVSVTPDDDARDVGPRHDSASARKREKRVRARARAAALLAPGAGSDALAIERPLYNDDDDVMPGNVKTKR